MAEDPNRRSTVKYTESQATSEEVEQTERMSRSRIRHGVIVSIIALALVIVVVAIAT